MSTYMANAATADQKWFVIDAADQVVGRLAVTIANMLRGKHKPEYTPHCDTGDFIIVVNAEKVAFTGKKWDQKEYQDYSHYAGGQKITPAKEMLAKKPEEILRRAVKRMMPRPAWVPAVRQVEDLRRERAPAPSPTTARTQAVLKTPRPE